MIRRPKKNEFQLDLFAPRSPTPRSTKALLATEPSPGPVGADRSRVPMLATSGWYELVPRPEKPTSRATGGCLNAIEAHRAMTGLSLELAGLDTPSGSYCARCMRFLFFNPRAKPLFEAARAGSRVRGSEFKCARCSNSFVAHRSERA